MATIYEVLNARVKQKIATEQDWIAQEADFGVIFEGEAAYVLGPDGSTLVNFKIGDGTKLFSDLPYFIAYYTGVTGQKVLSWINTTANITVNGQFKNNTLLTDIIIYNNSGSVIPLKIGTTNGGNEMLQVDVPNGANSIGRKFAFSEVDTLYLTGITGLECSIFLLYIQMDENPAIPPSSSVSSKFPAGYVGIFEEVPSIGLLYATVWDFTTGLAKLGFGYDNCVICGAPGTDSKIRAGAFSFPFKVGQTFGANVGSGLNAAMIDITNINPFSVPIPASENGTGNGSQARAAWSDNEAKNRGNIPSVNVGGTVPFNIQNYGIIDLWFKAVS